MLLILFAGFTPLSVFSLVTSSCTAKPSTTEKTLHTKPHLRGVLLCFPNHVRISHHGRFRSSSITGNCSSTLADCTGANGQRGCAEAEQSSVQSYLPAFSEHLYAGTNLQRQWDLKMGWFASCAWTTNPASQPSISTAIILSQKEVLHIPHYTQYCWSVFLNIPKRKAILNSSASFSFPFLEN